MELGFSWPNVATEGFSIGRVASQMSVLAEMALVIAGDYGGAIPISFLVLDLRQSHSWVESERRFRQRICRMAGAWRLKATMISSDP